MSKPDRLTYCEQLKIAAFDTANNWLRMSKEQWHIEFFPQTKEQAIRKLLRETYLTIEEIEIK